MASAYSCQSPAFAFTPSITCKPAVVVANLSSTLHIPRSMTDCRGVRRRLTGDHFPPSERGHFKAPLKVADSYPTKKRHCISPSTKSFQTENMDKESNSDVEAVGALSMRDLISSYREALLNGITENVYEMESAICSIEREKNELATKAVELTAEVDSTKKKFLLLNADLDNFRKHSEKEHSRLTNDCKVEVIKSLLPMVDSFEKAKQQVKAETEKEKKIDASYRGIYKQFVETLRALGVSAVLTTGRQFDPLVHEAVARVGSQRFREGIVIEEICRGFLLKNQVLRQATVKVSSGLGRKSPSLVEETVKKPAAAASVESQNSDSDNT